MIILRIIQIIFLIGRFYPSKGQNYFEEMNDTDISDVG